VGLRPAPLSHLGVLEVIPVMHPWIHLRLHYHLHKTLTLVTLKPYVSNVRTLLEVPHNMMVGRSNKRETAQQL
jgi:hypothetical protein